MNTKKRSVVIPLDQLPIPSWQRVWEAHDIAWRHPERQAIFRRVGRTDADQARWVLGFAERDLRNLPEGELGDHYEEMLALIHLRGLVVDWSQSPDPGDLGAHLLGEVRRVHRRLKNEMEGFLRFRRFFTFTNPRHSQVYRDAKGATRWVVRGDFRAIFMWAVADALGHVGGRLRVCGDPTCVRLFVARGRQAYCSDACSQRVRTKKYRTVNRDRFRECRRKYWARKQRQRTGFQRLRVGRKAKEG